MSLRQKLLLWVSLTVAAAVAAVAWTVRVRIRHVFEQRDQQETALFVSQFQREFQHRSAEIAAAVERLADEERVRAMAFELVQSGDAAPYLTEAQTLAGDAQLDFLEIVGPDGNVVSSAQWPARFGFAETAVASAAQTSFLKRESLPDGNEVLGLFAVRAIRGAEPAVHLVGGRRLDQSFLTDLPVAPGMQVYLYGEAPTGSTDAAASADAASTAFDARRLVGPSGVIASAARYQLLIDGARESGQPASGVLYLTDRREDSVNATAIPLKDGAGATLAVLVVTLSRGGMVATQQHINTIAYSVAASGILLAILLSLWTSARVSQPIEQLARAAEEVAAGNWETRVPERGRDELSVLARSFNHMTGELSNQRERLMQSERVAAWRELARRLAHELKNPLFPLQLTVENLARARALPPEEFDEVFAESTRTLSMEIANLKAIIGRFSDFSKMPRPQLERIDAKDVLERVRALYQNVGAGMAAQIGAKIAVETEIADEPMPMDADPELLHRALSNLVLNAMDAMPEGGIIRLEARPKDERVELRVADTGVGLTPEECERLFTPYYTTKQHGTGLGLAIVQSVIADHAGTISVESRPAGGTVFVIALPKAEA